MRRRERQRGRLQLGKRLEEITARLRQKDEQTEDQEDRNRIPARECTCPPLDGDWEYPVHDVALRRREVVMGYFTPWDPGSRLPGLPEDDGKHTINCVRRTSEVAIRSARLVTPRQEKPGSRTAHLRGPQCAI